MSVRYLANGQLADIRWPDTAAVQFRADCYGGPALWIWPEGEGGQPVPVALHPAGDHAWAGTVDGICFTMAYQEGDRELVLDIRIRNPAASLFAPKRCELRLGIDTYMVKYPDWNALYFPTLIRCEKTHAWGYLMTPRQDMLVIASKDPIAAWHHSYARADYGRAGGHTDTGHRIYTTSLDLLNKGPLPARHPQHLAAVEPGGERRFRILLAAVPHERDVAPRVSAYTGAPLIQMDKYTYELGETAHCRTDGEVSFVSPAGQRYAGSVTLDEYGVWWIRSVNPDKESEACIYVRRPWSWYMEAAREAALACPQKAATHTESWYGFFSAFLARKYRPAPPLDTRLEADFERIFGLMHDRETMFPVAAAEPGRIQNSAMMTSLLVDAWEATGRLVYLERAAALADFLIRYQGEDGAYRCGSGVHYTAVIYIAKSMLEIWQAERGQAGADWEARSQRHYRSASRAVEELRVAADDIQTEGEMTFEDGMIACSSLQLGLFALLLQAPDQRAPYAQAAESMLRKHRCLEGAQVPDCRMRGATLRFWETMYDVMIPQNMMTSPHGWTSWKTYATYYLYRLTGKKRYLVETMDTLGACMQVVDIESGRLRWAFVPDPYVEADVFVEDAGLPGKGRMSRQVIGEQYLEMVSGWWRAAPDTVTKGYAFPDGGIVDGPYQGSACDNDVHEHFKCLEEVALTKAFAHQAGDAFLAYNCRVASTDDGITVTPRDDRVREWVVYLERPMWIRITGQPAPIAGTTGFTILHVQ